MRKQTVIVFALCLLSVSTYAQTSVITSLQSNGVITWTNNVTNAIYSIEWSSSLNGPWSFSWDSLINITSGTNLSMSTSVPMFYRVKMIPEAEVLTVFATPSTLNADSDMAILTVSGGKEPYSWSVVDSSKGGLPVSNTGASVIYERYSPGDNAVIVTDSADVSALLSIEQP